MTMIVFDFVSIQDVVLEVVVFQLVVVMCKILLDPLFVSKIIRLLFVLVEKIVLGVGLSEFIFELCTIISKIFNVVVLPLTVEFGRPQTHNRIRNQKKDKNITAVPWTDENFVNRSGTRFSAREASQLQVSERF